MIHRDLKPENILINSEGTVKLTDFGIARSLENTSGVCTTYLGTNTHLSPERILGEEYSFSADIWSLGLVVYELATLVFPYEANTTLLLIDKIISESEPVLQRSNEHSAELCDFLKKCLKKDPKERDTITELCVSECALFYITKYLIYYLILYFITLFRLILGY